MTEMSDGVHTPESQSQNVLTGIPMPLQCPAASEEGYAADEANEATAQAFIETLARIAYAVATRRTQKQQEKAEQ